MANESLKNALEHAGLTVEQFAEIIEVDPKSVQRWVSGPTVPYPRHRARIAAALDLDEHDLWPEQTPKTTRAEANQVRARSERVGDVTGAWASSDDDGAPDLVAFLSGTTGPIDVLDSCCGIDIPTQLTDALIERAAAGRKVRILTDGRAPHWERLLTNEQVGLYLCEIPGEYWLIKTSERMLLTVNLEAEPASSPPPPLLELTAGGGEGLFQRLASRFEELWELTKETGTESADEAASATRSQAPGSKPDPEPKIGSDAGGRRWPGQRS